jgi:alpha 1,2-mannosyltransferase
MTEKTFGSKILSSLGSYDWYWRVEPGVRFFCDITYDPFLFMQKHNKQYGFVITLLELKDTIPTLWDTVLDYAKSRKIDLGMSAIAGKSKSKSLFPYFLDETNGYNLCHFWSNFEIGSLNLWRSSNYQDFFAYLDQTGNFFYERWGDAPGKRFRHLIGTHSIEAVLNYDASSSFTRRWPFPQH